MAQWLTLATKQNIEENIQGDECGVCGVRTYARKIRMYMLLAYSANAGSRATTETHYIHIQKHNGSARGHNQANEVDT